MKEYLPWSEETLNTAIEKYRNGRFSILDIQLSGECNGNCTYCDSPDRNKMCTINFDALENLISKEDCLFDWMFVCGLGEPLAGSNKEKFLYLLGLCEKYGIRCSTFTNGSLIDNQIISYVKKGVLFLMIKMDSFSVNIAEELYGSSVVARKNLEAINVLFELAKTVKSDYCHIGASIVPTQKNVNEIPAIIEKCLAQGVFPLIAELEYSGKSIEDTYDDLHLTRDEHLILKDKIEQVLGEKYKVPVCPAVIRSEERRVV